MSVDDLRGEDIIGGDLVYTRAPQADALPQSRSATVRAQEARLLSFVDGHRTVAEILRLSPLGPPTTLQYLRSLQERGVLLRAPAPGVPAPRPRTTSGAQVIVIDTRHRDRAAAPAPAPAPSLGSSPSLQGALFKLGRYEVATRIGQGGMGSVYVCRLAGVMRSPQLFTLKVVRQYSEEHAVAEQSLLREGRIGSLLNSPNIQRVIETGRYKNQPFLILEYIEGVSLTDLLDGGRRPPPAVIVSILIDILRGLESAHRTSDEAGRALGLVHGDVSPPNVLVGADGVARLVDFGSSWIAAEDPKTRPPATALGKPSYMAPEQLRAEPLDARADVFALGAVMYLALTGQELFLADTYEAVVLNVLRKRIAPPSDFGAPPALDEICLRALSRSREGRFASAGEMADTLFRAAMSNGLVASPSEVAAYIRREFGEVIEEQRRRIQRAFEASASGSGSGVSPLPAPPTLPSTPAQGLPTTRTGDRLLAKTLFTPGNEPANEAPRPAPKEAPRPAPKEAPRPAPEASTVLQMLVRERRFILLAVAVGLAIFLVTVTVVRPSRLTALPGRPTPAPMAGAPGH
jgi:serine/threonine-protein kinase